MRRYQVMVSDNGVDCWRYVDGQGERWYVWAKDPGEAFQKAQAEQCLNGVSGILKVNESPVGEGE